MPGTDGVDLASITDRGSWEAVVAGCRVRFGAGARDATPQIVVGLGSRRPMLFTDPGVRATERVDELAERLAHAGLRPAVFAQVCENPTTDTVVAATQAALEHKTDLLIGFGGGSSMDTAKGVNFLLTNGGCMEDYEGVDRATEPMLPSIGIPTTAGTGSEAQRFALIARVKDHRKMACGDAKARFGHVILDPELTVTVPRRVAVATGIDALTHAIESHVSLRANLLSRQFSLQAWRLLSGSFEDSLRGDAGLRTRSRMLLGAHLAGVAIESSMLGAAHAGANPLTAQLELTHGVAVGLLMPHVVRFNAEVAADAYAELAAATAPEPASITATLDRLLAASGLPLRLRDHGVQPDALGSLAADAATQWTASFNPRPVGEADLRGIYEAAY